jgi:hypothetical protein
MITKQFVLLINSNHIKQSVFKYFCKLFYKIHTDRGNGACFFGPPIRLLPSDPSSQPGDAHAAGAAAPKSVLKKVNIALSADGHSTYYQYPISQDFVYCQYTRPPSALHFSPLQPSQIVNKGGVTPKSA